MAQWIFLHSCDCLKGDVTRDDSRRRVLAQHSVATLFQPCAKNRRFQFSRGSPAPFRALPKSTAGLLRGILRDAIGSG